MKNVQNGILPETALEAISAGTIPTSDKLIHKIKLSHWSSKECKNAQLKFNDFSNYSIVLPPMHVQAPAQDYCRDFICTYLSMIS